MVILSERRVAVSLFLLRHFCLPGLFANIFIKMFCFFIRRATPGNKSDSAFYRKRNRSTFYRKRNRFYFFRKRNPF